MQMQEAYNEYLAALKLGQKEYRAAVQAQLDPFPEVLDQLLAGQTALSTQDLGIVDIPADRIIGIRSAGRTAAFTKNFLPVLDADTEFANKWMALYLSHMDEGIRDPIVCYEYLGNFYVQEGNKRVSVLRYLGAPRIVGEVHRILPTPSNDPKIKAYYEFLDFYKVSKLYQVQFRRPGGYASLLSHLGKSSGELFDERERRTFSTYFQYFREAYEYNGGDQLDLPVEEALLLWLQVHPFRDLGTMRVAELRKSVGALWSDMITLSDPEPVQLHTEANDAKPGVLSRILSGAPSKVTAAFICPSDPEHSPWVQGHCVGWEYLQTALASQVKVLPYFHADTPELAQEKMEEAVAAGADVVFTITPQMSRSTLKMAVKHPKVRFLNCSVDTIYASVRTYYSRIFEAKFITGAIAGAMATEDFIGYVGSSPIYGVPASINAFALGTQLTNPRARILLRWSCQSGNYQEEFFARGVQVVSNRDVPTRDKEHLHFCNYGTYTLNADGSLTALASPVWDWGKFYEKVVGSVLAGTYNRDQDPGKAVNYWWGMDSGVIDIEFADSIPEGVRTLAEILRQGLRNGTIDPFARRIVAQDGTVINDGSRTLTTDELLHMDWLCSNVDGSIPEYDEIEPFAQPIVRQLGIHRESIPVPKEGSL